MSILSIAAFPDLASQRAPLIGPVVVASPLVNFGHFIEVTNNPLVRLVACLIGMDFPSAVASFGGRANGAFGLAAVFSHGSFERRDECILFFGWVCRFEQGAGERTTMFGARLKDRIVE